MFSFFLISMIWLLENVTFIHFRCNLGHVPYSLNKICCLQIWLQYFDHTLCNVSVAQWQSFSLIFTHFFALWKVQVRILGEDIIFGHFLAKSQQPLAVKCMQETPIIFAKIALAIKGNWRPLEEVVLKWVKSYKFSISYNRKNFNFNF